MLILSFERPLGVAARLGLCPKKREPAIPLGSTTVESSRGRNKAKKRKQTPDVTSGASVRIMIICILIYVCVAGLAHVLFFVSRFMFLDGFPHAKSRVFVCCLICLSCVVFRYAKSCCEYMCLNYYFLGVQQNRKPPGGHFIFSTYYSDHYYYHYNCYYYFYFYHYYYYYTTTTTTTILLLLLLLLLQLLLLSPSPFAS